MQQAGKFLQNLGLGQMANAHLSMPDTSGKVWMNMSRKSAKTHRPDIKRKDSKKYDWRPKGDTPNPSGGSTWKGEFRKLKGREAHWARRPKYNQGIYSQPTQSEIHYHQKSQMRRGQAKYGIGTGMRMLGRGLLIVQLGVYASWLYDDPSEDTVTDIVKDLTLVEQIDELIIQPWTDWLGVTPDVFTAQ